MHRIRTRISVLDIPRFTLFLNANDMKDIIVGHYECRRPDRPYQIDNLICYAYSDTSESVETLMVLSIKYGSLEAAYNHFRKVISTSTPVSLF